MGFEDAGELIKPLMEEVNRFLRKTVDNISEEKTKEYMEYFMKGKAHRLRPILALLSYNCYRQNYDSWSRLDLIKLSAAIELLHTASLIHDDVIDEETERRGQKALNKVAGNKASILVGNVFYLEAFKIASQLPSSLYFQSMVNTSKEMCFGEIIQSQSLEKPLSTEDYLDIIRRKTALLISMSCSEGARLAGADETQIEVMKEIGLIIGYLYQIKDDVKDWDVKLEKSVEIGALVSNFHSDFERKIEKLRVDVTYKAAICEIERAVKLN